MSNLADNNGPVSYVPPCVQPLLETMAGFNGEKKVFGAKIMLLLESKAKKIRHLCFIDTQLLLKMKKQLFFVCFKIIFLSLFLSKCLLEWWIIWHVTMSVLMKNA